MNMKTRLTVTIDPEVLERAKKLAYARKTNVSALVEELLRSSPISSPTEPDFAARWAGKFSVAPTRADDERMKALKAKFKLPAAANRK